MCYAPITDLEPDYLLLATLTASTTTTANVTAAFIPPSVANNKCNILPFIELLPHFAYPILQNNNAVTTKTKVFSFNFIEV